LKDLIKSQNKDLKDFLAEMIENKFDKLKSKIISETVKKNTDLLEKTMESFQHVPVKPDHNKKLFVHNVACRGDCGSRQIEGIRYKCSICVDFDYCGKCEEKFAESHFHPFLKCRVAFPVPQKVEEVKKGEKERTFLNAKCITDNYSKFEQGQKTLNVQVQLENNGNVSWPEGCSVRNVQGYFGEKVKIYPTVKPGEKIFVAIDFIVEGLKAGQYSSRWQLYDKKDDCFGGFIDMVFKVQEEPKKERVYRFYSKLAAMKEAYFLNNVPKEQILEALEKANGNVEEAIIYLL